MPALQNLVVSDRQATPVNYTLVPDNRLDGGNIGVVSAADATGAAITKKSLSIGRKKSGNRIRITERWKFPTIVTETINGVSSPKVARTGYIDVTFNFEESHTAAERKDMLGMFHSAHNVGKVLTEGMIVNDEGLA